MKITRIKIRNYRGIQAFDQTLPERGAIAKGRNGAGKTSILKAIQAALLARDVKADAIRLGEQRAEIQVDLDDHSVRRIITQSGQRLDVLKDGMSAPAPQTYLTQLLGTSSLDPLALMLASEKERREQILSALPISVTMDQVRAWWPECPEIDTSKHGLEVVAAARAKAYEERARYNRELKSATQAEELAAEAFALAKREAPETLPDLTQAKERVRSLSSALERLEARAEQASAQQKAQLELTGKAEQCRSQASWLRAQSLPVKETELARARAELERLTELTERFEQELAEVRAQAREKAEELRELEQHNERAQGLSAKAQALEDQASAIEQSIKASAVEPVSKAMLDEAHERLAEAEHQLTEGLRAESSQKAAREAAEALEQMRARKDAAKQLAARFDEAVKRLDAASSQLLASSNAIEGVSLDGQTVTLDGVRLDALSGAEQMRFCVEVAKRANAKSKILVVDGLERLDPEQFEAFVREATSGGYQLIGTRVDRGDVVLEAIEPEPTQATKEIRHAS